ncbi:MAG: hypothetical protein ACRYHQ_07885 [Janthinobacterium lividum]
MSPSGVSPTLAPVVHRPGADHQVLHVIRLIAFEVRAGRIHGPQHLGLHLDPWRHLATAPLLATLAAAGQLGAFLHPARLDRGAALQALQSRNLVTLRSNQRLQLHDLAEQLNQQRLQIGAR